MEALNTGFVTLVAPVAFFYLQPELVHADAYIETFLIWMLYFGMVIWGWVLSPRVGARFVYKVFRSATLGYTHRDIPQQHLRWLTHIFFGLYLLSYVALMVFSGMGTLWLTTPRMAYQNNGQTGAGTFFVTSCAFLTVAYLLSLFLVSPRSKRSPKQILALRTTFFMICAYFLGSKGVMLSMLIGSAAYYNYVIAPLRLRTVLFFILFVVVGFMLLQITGTASTGAESNATSAILYFDYFHNTSEFLRRFSEFGYRWGATNLSDFWTYVPRPLYPDKPKLWGQMVINEVLFPGAAEGGYTPAEGPWAADYLDFGLVGVVLSGLLHGLGLGWVHHFFRARPNNPLRYMLLMQFSKIAVISTFLPVMGFLVAVFCCVAVLRWLGAYFAVLVHPVSPVFPTSSPE
jgi:hypothetical protein